MRRGECLGVALRYGGRRGRYNRADTTPMMQQEREKEQDTTLTNATKKAVQSKVAAQQVFRYNKWLFWLTHLHSFGHFLALLGPIIWIVQEHRIDPLWFIGAFFLLAQSWYSTRKLRRWIREHGHETILVDDEKIEWHDGKKVVTMLWDEIAQSYKQDDVYVLVKKGTEEEEIRFYDTVYLVAKDLGWMAFMIFMGPHSGHLSGYIKNVSWEEKDKETLHTPSPRSAYQIAGAQIHSYHTKDNQFKEFGWMIASAYLAFFPLVRAYKAPFSLWSLAGLVYISFALWYVFRVRSWYHQSQIEVDDLGIALVEPKGVTWRVPWFVIARYKVDGDHGMITTKDGKTYQFRRATARKEELDGEIWRRIGQNPIQ
jgi:hypothetical protein